MQYNKNGLYQNIGNGGILMSAEKKKNISQDDIMKMLDACYEKALHGIPGA